MPRLRLSAIPALLAAVSVVLAPITLSAGPLDPPAEVGPTYKTLDQVRPGTPITYLPYVIEQPGVYFLASDLTHVSDDPAIAVNAPNVTVDLGGFTLTGPSPDGASRGVQGVGSAENLRVINGNITGFGIGVEVQARNSEIRHIRAQACGWGIYAGGRIADCTAIESLHAGFYTVATLYFIPGFGGFTSTGNTIIERCAAVANAEAGFAISDNTHIVDSVASINRRAGIQAYGPCRIERCSVTGTVADPNGGYTGVGIGLSPGCTVSDSTVSNNQDAGILLADNCVVKGCTVYNNTNIGIGGPNDGSGGVSTGSNCEIRNCTVSVHPGNATGYGIAVNDNSAVIDNTVRECYEAGIYVRNNCRVTGNNASRNGHTGGSFNFSCQIVTFGVRNHIEGNTCTSGPNNGIMILGSRNVIIRNMAGGNIVNFLVSGNIFGPVIDKTTSSTGITTSDPSANISY